MKGRQDSIIKYLEERGIETMPVSPEEITAYNRSWEECWLKIEHATKEQARLVAEMRHVILF